MTKAQRDLLRNAAHNEGFLPDWTVVPVSPRTRYGLINQGLLVAIPTGLPFQSKLRLTPAGRNAVKEMIK